ncbi:MAG: hypothetical protein HY717_07205 [Planctomycetes bacterium]|nr:hypothetical protein [Planctomycetota bacterium]
MDVFVYQSPNGLIADFRPYLDGTDNAFDPPRPLKANDPRLEKVVNLLCPRTQQKLYGKVKFAGYGMVEKYHELMMFPVAYEGEVEPK